jgi:hypothetical protein
VEIGYLTMYQAVGKRQEVSQNNPNFLQIAQLFLAIKSIATPS